MGIPRTARRSPIARCITMALGSNSIATDAAVVSTSCVRGCTALVSGAGPIAHRNTQIAGAPVRSNSARRREWVRAEVGPLR